MEELPSSPDDGSNVRVLVRLRPQPPAALTGAAHHAKAVAVDTAGNRVLVTGKDGAVKTFTFDAVADDNVSQAKMFELAGQSAADSCLQGYNCCLFAYGQTGAGKTFTMEGPESTWDNEAVAKEGERALATTSHGLIPRALAYLFTRIQHEISQTKSELKYTCYVSSLQFYMEDLHDLLQPENTNIKLREDRHQRVHIDGVSELVVSTAEAAYAAFRTSTANRKVGSTDMNAESSRSHSVFTLKLESEMTGANGVTKKRASRFHFVDLAGSEQQKHSHAQGHLLREAGKINKSLSALGNVIKALVDNAQGKDRHVPYRDSKLTHMLKDSLGGNSKCVIVANIAPAALYLEETISTLKFAQRAKEMKNEAVVNEDTFGSVQAMALQIRHLNLELAALKQASSGPVSTTGTGQAAEVVELRRRVAALQTALVKVTSESDSAERRAVNEARRLTDHVQALEEKCYRLDQAQQAQKMILKFRDNMIRKLERDKENVNGNVDAGSRDAQIAALQAEILQLRKQVEFHPDIVQYKMDNDSLKEKAQQREEQLRSYTEVASERKQMQDALRALQMEVSIALEEKLAATEKAVTLTQTLALKLESVRGQLRETTAKKASLQVAFDNQVALQEEMLVNLEQEISEKLQVTAEFKSVAAIANMVPTLESNLQVALKEKATLEEDSHTLRDHIDSLSHECETLQSDLVHVTVDGIIRRVVDAEEHTNYAHESRVMLVYERWSNDELQLYCLKLSSEMESVRNNAAASANIVDRVMVQCSCLEADNMEMMDELARVKLTANTLGDDIEMLEDALAKATEDRRSVEEDKRAINAYILELESDKVLREAKLASVVADLATARTQLDAVEELEGERECREESEARASNLLEELQERDAEASELESALDHEKHGHQSTVQALEHAVDQVVALEAGVEELRERLGEKERRVGEGERRVVDMGREVEKLRGEGEVCKDALEKARVQLAGAFAGIAGTSLRVKLLQQEVVLKDKQLRHAAENVHTAYDQLLELSTHIDALIDGKERELAHLRQNCMAKDREHSTIVEVMREQAHNEVGKISRTMKETVEQLMARLDEVGAEKDVLTMTLQEAQSQQDNIASDASARVESLQMQLNIAHADNEVMQVSHHAALEEQKAKFKQLEEDCKELEVVSKDLLTQRDALTKHLERAHAMRVPVERELEESHAALQALESQHSDVTAQLTDAHEQLVSRIAQINEAWEAVVRLQTKEEDWRAEKQALERTLREERARCAEIENDAASLCKQLAEAEISQTRLKAKLVETAAGHKAACEAADLTTAKCEQQARTICNLQREVEDANRQSNQLNSDLTQAQVAREVALSAEEAALASLAEKGAEHVSMCSKLQGDICHKAEQLADLQRELCEVGAAKESVEAQLALARADYGRLAAQEKRAGEAASAKIRSLAKELDVAHASTRCAEDTLLEASARVQASAREAAMMREECAQLRSRVEKDKVQVIEMEQLLQASNTAKVELQNRLDEGLRSLSEEHERCAHLAASNKDLEKKLMRARGEADNLRSEFGQVQERPVALSQHSGRDNAPKKERKGSGKMTPTNPVEYVDLTASDSDSKKNNGRGKENKTNQRNKFKQYFPALVKDEGAEDKCHVRDDSSDSSSLGAKLNSSTDGKCMGEARRQPFSNLQNTATTERGYGV
eukprot:jgi/Chlat1/9052/Chrsp94S00704